MPADRRMGFTAWTGFFFGACPNDYGMPRHGIHWGSSLKDGDRALGAGRPPWEPGPEAASWFSRRGKPVSGSDAVMGWTEKGIREDQHMRRETHTCGFSDSQVPQGCNYQSAASSYCYILNWRQRERIHFLSDRFNEAIRSTGMSWSRLPFGYQRRGELQSRPSTQEGRHEFPIGLSQGTAFIRGPRAKARSKQSAHQPLEVVGSDPDLGSTPLVHSQLHKPHAPTVAKKQSALLLPARPRIHGSGCVKVSFFPNLSSGSFACLTFPVRRASVGCSLPGKQIYILG